MWLATESDDEYYAAEWESAGERNYEFYMLIYSRRFSRHNALYEKRGLRLEANVIALLSSLVGKSTRCHRAILCDRSFISTFMFECYFLKTFFWNYLYLLYYNCLI